MNAMDEKSPKAFIVLDKGQQPHSRSSSGDPLGAEQSNEQPSLHNEGHHQSLLRSVIIVLVVTFSMVVNVGNTTAVSISLPTIGRDFGADPSLLQWIVSVYPLSSGCLLLVCGRLADLYGRKKVYLIGTFFLAAITLGCGFANDIITLIVLRGVQGIGAAAILPAAIGILAHAFPPSKARAFAFATFAAGAPVGAAFGSAVGGVLTEKTASTWRSSFYLFTVVNVLCYIGGLLCINKDTPHPNEDRKVDWLGALLVTAGLVLILFVLGEGEIAPNGWTTGYIIALLVIGVFLVLVFLYWQWFLEKIQDERDEQESVRSQVPKEGEAEGQAQEPPSCGRLEKLKRGLPPPVMKLSLWGRANARFAVTMAIAFLTWSSFTAWTFWVQLYYQNYIGISPLQTVVRLLPMFVTGMLCNAFVGVMASRMSMVAILTLGTLGTSLACVLFAIIDTKAIYWAYGFPATIISVLGVDFVYSAGTLYIAKISLPHEQSLAAALFSTMVQLGTSAGVTITTVVFNRVTAGLDLQSSGSALEGGRGGDVIESYRAAQWTACGFGIVGALLSIAFFRGVGVPGHTRAREKGANHNTLRLEGGEIGPERSAKEKETA